MSIRMSIRSLRNLALSGVALLSLAGAAHAPAQAAAPQRPKITGISHVAYYVTDIQKGLAFWHDFLGYDQYFELKTPETGKVRIAFIKINDLQHVELFTDKPVAPPNMMSHICFTVDDIEQMRAYLRSKGFNVPPGNSAKTKAGDYAFEIKDPDGTLVEFVQSLPNGQEALAKGKFLPPTRIAPSIYHVGFLVGNTPKSLAFYHDVLGFEETWRGGRDPKVLSWINMRVPDGTDYVELMLYAKLPETYGTSNHTSLVVPDMAKAIAELQTRPAAKIFAKTIESHVGVNGKLQVNLYDADGTRVELMESHTADGLPRPPSQAPPPPPAHD